MAKSLEQIKLEFDSAIRTAELSLSDPVTDLNKILGTLGVQGGYPVSGSGVDCKSTVHSGSGGSTPSSPTNK